MIYCMYLHVIGLIVYSTTCLTPVAARHNASDTGNTTILSTLSSLTIELSALTAAALRIRLRELNLPASGNKAALIERLEQSTSPDDPGTQCEQPTDSATSRLHQADPPAPAQQTCPSGSVTQHHTDTTSGSNPPLQ